MKYLYFLLTGDCNLRCRYCFQEQVPESGTTKEVIDALAVYCRENEIGRVELFGGEPLMDRDLFRYTVTQLENSCPDIRISMITNGTLVDSPTMAFLKEHEISILLSLDGTRETHNRMRGGFDDIVRWVTHFDNPSRIRVALQAAQVKGLYDNIRYVWDLGFAGGVFVNVIQNYGWYSEDDIAAFEPEYEKALLGMLRGEGVLDCANKLFDAINQSFQRNMNCGICSVGLAADWKGRLYPCQRAGELGEEFIIGDLWKGIDRAKENEIRSSILNSVSSSRSASDYLVAGHCPVSLYKHHHSFNGEWSEGFCRIIETKAKLVAKHYYQMRDYYVRKPWDPHYGQSSQPNGPLPVLVAGE